MKSILAVLLFVASLTGAGCAPATVSLSTDSSTISVSTTSKTVPASIMPTSTEAYIPVGEFSSIRFFVPQGFAVEYVEKLQALNLYPVVGDGTSLDRSMIFIRYFDADRFLTLSTVRIHSTEDVSIGKGGYDARRYDIEKRDGIPDFAGQPKWRNVRHIVTDTRKQSGFTRYYVIAQNPDLEEAVYSQFLQSFEIVETRVIEHAK